MQEKKQTTTTTTNERPVQTVQRSSASASGSVVAKRIVYYIGGFIIALIALRFVFLLLGANQGSPFVDFIYGISNLFVLPFNGIFGEPTFGVSFFETSSLVAIVVYALLTVGVGKLFTLNRPAA
jgi:hypothetical protein